MCQWSIKAALVVCAASQLLSGRAASAQGLCMLPHRPVTIRDTAAECPIVVYAKLENSQKDPEPLGSSSFVIIKILKSDPAIVDRKSVTISRYLEIPDPKKPPNFLLFADVDKQGQPDFYRGIPGTPALSDYVLGLLAIDPKGRSKLLKYCFDYLDHADQAVANDASNEYSKADDTELRGVAKSLDSDKLRRWLQNDKTSTQNANLFGLLLGLCGTPADATLLQQVFDASKERQPTLSQLLAGYTMLTPKDGWAYTSETINEPNANFQFRCLALRNAHYFYSSTPRIISEQQILDVVQSALQYRDMADLAIEDLRHWKCWKLTEQVLALADKKEFENSPFIRRSILRYALTCPAHAAKKYADKIRENNPELFAEIKEALTYERP